MLSAHDERSAFLEAVIREVTQPIEGQYPRPWMTSLTDPSSAAVFIVGMNQHNAFAVKDVGTHDRYVEALFNRGPETCRALYDRVAPKPSPTRLNTDRLVQLLAKNNATSVLETNIICYSTPMSADLKQAIHSDGVKRGYEIFQALLEIIRPSVIIVHGAGAKNKLATLIGYQLPELPEQFVEPVSMNFEHQRIFVIPSLAPPAFNRWANWSAAYLSALAESVALSLNVSHDRTVG